MEGNFEDTLIITSSILSLITTLIILTKAGGKTGFKRSLMGAFLGLIGCIVIIFFGMVVTLAVQFIANYPVDIVLTAIIIIAVFAIPFGAYLLSKHAKPHRPS